MREVSGATGRRRARRTVVAIAAVVALGSVVVASATSLGGTRTQDLGAAAGDPQQLTEVTLDWTPVWQDGEWRAGALRVAADPERGFLAGDVVSVAVTGAASCEVDTVIAETSEAVELTAAQLDVACGEAPVLDADTDVAISITGSDGVTVVSDVGELAGSVSGFASTVVDSAADLTAELDIDNGTVHSLGLEIAETADDLEGARVFLAILSDTTARNYDVVASSASDAAAAITDGGDGARIDVALADLGWTVSGTVDLQVAVSTAQVLQIGVHDTPGMRLVSASVDAGSSGGGSGGGSNGGGDGGGDDGTGGSEPIEPTEPAEPTEPTTPGSGLDPVVVSAGITYSYSTPWSGAQTNLLTFCHQFTVTNTTGAALSDWTVQFDTTLAPMWGMDPTVAGTVRLSNIETRAYDASTGYWTLGGANDWARQIEAGGSRTVQFCADSVPTPDADPSLFDVTVSVEAGNDWYVTFRVEVTSTSEFYVPWSVEVDFADLVCGSSLSGHPISFQQVSATALADGTSYLVQGTAGNTMLVSASSPRSFTFASYSPGPGWQLPCSGS